jgi:hypothetical protein
MTSKRWTIFLAIFLMLELSAIAAPVVSNAGGVSNIDLTTVTLNADVISTGSAAPRVIFFWGPDDQVTNDLTWSNVAMRAGVGLGLCSTNLSGLTGGAVYYYRAYADNVAGSCWATNTICWTQSCLRISTAAASNVQFSTATLAANLTATGAAQPYLYIFWGPVDRGTNWTWTHTNYFGAATNTGLVSTNISGLTTNTAYWFRSYASNSSEAAWSAYSVGWTTRTVSTVGRFLLIGPNGVISNCTNFAAANGLAGPAQISAFSTQLWSNAVSDAAVGARVTALEAGTNVLTNAVARTGDVITGALHIQSDLYIEQAGYLSNYIPDSFFATGISHWSASYGSVSWTNNRLRAGLVGSSWLAGIFLFTNPVPAGSYELVMSFTTATFSVDSFIELLSPTNNVTIYNARGGPVSLRTTNFFSTSGGILMFDIDGDGISTNFVDFEEISLHRLVTNTVFLLSTNGTLYGPGTNIVWSAP